MPESVAQLRIVPGAPPPTPLSKSQVKRRKAKAKARTDGDDTPATPLTATTPLATEKARESSEPRESSLAPETINRSESQATPLPEEDVLLKPSPIVDLVHKRLKATTKKIGRITVYASTDPDKLNDDQKRTLKTLPVLEAIQKELGEVKKAIEVHEAELVQELTAKRLEAEKAEKARIADAVTTAEVFIQTLSPKIWFTMLTMFLRPPCYQKLTIFLTSFVSVHHCHLVLRTSPTLLTRRNCRSFSATDALVSEDEERKQAAVKSLIFGKEFDGVASSRLSEIVNLAFNPPRAPTPPPEEEPEQVSEILVESIITEAVVEIEVPATATVAGIPSSAVGGSFQFMQDSEIEASTFEETAEWIEKSDAIGHDEQPEPQEQAVNGHATRRLRLLLYVTNGPLDWAADDEGGLPSIAGLQAEFGTSGSATPAEATPAAETAPHTEGAPTLLLLLLLVVSMATLTPLSTPGGVDVAAEVASAVASVVDTEVVRDVVDSVVDVADSGAVRDAVGSEVAKDEADSEVARAEVGIGEVRDAVGTKDAVDTKGAVDTEEVKDVVVVNGEAAKVVGAEGVVDEDLTEEASAPATPTTPAPAAAA
ncbi:hypothetical protein CPB84DRAFT_1752363 [Gymnopilus junonius]|uniref:Uncharacterized protein n=1 Tax=Gymnopilus junonius TaxID=109634 RepID=A0A9P5TG43_GYMJU|nr:hypothetical protein CPB84DRAFT_1752363 [Gymnopilus junonius]